MIKIQYLLFRLKNQFKSIFFKKRGLLVFFILLILAFYLYPAKYSIPARVNSDMVVVKKLSLYEQFKHSLNGIVSSAKNSRLGVNMGILPENTHPTVPGEQVNLSLSSEEFTQIANNAKPVYVPLTNIQLEFKDGIIFASGISMIPIMPGKISGSMKAMLNQASRLPEFEIIDGYLAGIPASKKLTDFFKMNGEAMLAKVLRDYQIDVLSFQISGDRLIVSALVPQGIIYRQDGKLILDLTKKP